MDSSLARKIRILEKRKRVESVIDLIGNTPLIRLTKIVEGLNPDIEVYAKAEWFNPGGSIKDRPALWMILDGIRTGKLSRNKIIMDSSSGNTAIAYAMIGAALDYRVELVTPANMNIERKRTLEAFGAKMILSDSLEGSDGAIKVARRLRPRTRINTLCPTSIITLQIHCLIMRQRLRRSGSRHTAGSPTFLRESVQAALLWEPEGGSKNSTPI